MAKRYCRFCGDRADSREHVLPEWLRGVLPDQGKVWNVEQQRVGEGGGITTRTFDASPFTQRVRYVCNACNTGWMSKLENDAKPFLASMIQGRGRELHGGGRRLVSVWAFKTAAMFDVMGLAGGVLPDEHLRWLYEHREQADPLPPHMYVWIAAYGAGGDAPVYRHHGLIIEPMGGSRDSGDPNGYVATFTVGHLALQVFGTVEPDGFKVENFGKMAAATTLQIWPHEGGPVLWPPQGYLTRGGLDAWSEAVVTHPR